MSQARNWLTQLQSRFDEFIKTEADISHKAANLVSVIDPFLNSNKVPSESELIFLMEAYKQAKKLSTEAYPFGESQNIDASLIAERMMAIDMIMSDPNQNGIFRQRACAMIWFAINYSKLTHLLKQLGSHNTQIDFDLIAPMQRITKFGLFAEEALAVLNQLPSNIFPDEAKQAFARLRFRSLGIANMTNELIRTREDDASLMQLSSPAVMGIAINQAVEQMLLGIDQVTLSKLLEDIKIEMAEHATLEQLSQHSFFAPRVESHEQPKSSPRQKCIIS